MWIFCFFYILFSAKNIWWLLINLPCIIRKPKWNIRMINMMLMMHWWRKYYFCDNFRWVSLPLLLDMSGEWCNQSEWLLIVIITKYLDSGQRTQNLPAQLCSIIFGFSPKSLIAVWYKSFSPRYYLIIPNTMPWKRWRLFWFLRVKYSV